jgi:antibiotic biosynthesis monooxygenase (ABM) superfamily enzyme
MTPVTTILKLKPKDGFEKDCLLWMQETANEASSFPGFVSKEIYRSAEEERLLLNIFTFQSLEELQAWENSTRRKSQTSKGALYMERLVAKNQLTGLEFWFQSAETKQHPLIKWKIVLVTVLVIFTLLNTLVPLLQIGFAALGFPALVKSLAGVSIMVSLMTYLIMPFVTKRLGRWLIR